LSCLTRRAAALGLVGLAAAGVPTRADGPVQPHLITVLQGLDKITARTTVLRIALGETVRFGTLEITPRACLTTPPTEPPESAAFLEIAVADPGRATTSAFSGWMFASSPSISALEHPVYDVWVIECAEPIETELPPPSPAPFAPPPATEGQNG
jgi:hypothetical protein